jgi:hypothetical protein
MSKIDEAAKEILCWLYDDSGDAEADLKAILRKHFAEPGELPVKVPPSRYLESYAGQKLVMVNREDLEEWAKAFEPKE